LWFRVIHDFNYGLFIFHGDYYSELQYLPFEIFSSFSLSVQAKISAIRGENTEILSEYLGLNIRKKKLSVDQVNNNSHNSLALLTTCASYGHINIIKEFFSNERFFRPLFHKYSTGYDYISTIDKLVTESFSYGHGCIAEWFIDQGYKLLTEQMGIALINNSDNIYNFFVQKDILRKFNKSIDYRVIGRILSGKDILKPRMAKLLYDCVVSRQQYGNRVFETCAILTLDLEIIKKSVSKMCMEPCSLISVIQNDRDDIFRYLSGKEEWDTKYITLQILHDLFISASKYGSKKILECLAESKYFYLKGIACCVAKEDFDDRLITDILRYLDPPKSFFIEFLFNLDHKSENILRFFLYHEVISFSDIVLLLIPKLLSQQCEGDTIKFIQIIENLGYRESESCKDGELVRVCYKNFRMLSFLIKSGYRCNLGNFILNK
jgi:hypothetical protein